MKDWSIISLTLNILNQRQFSSGKCILDMRPQIVYLQLVLELAIQWVGRIFLTLLSALHIFMLNAISLVLRTRSSYAVI